MAITEKQYGVLETMMQENEITIINSTTYKVGVKPVSGVLVGVLRRAGLIEYVGGAYRITDAGRSAAIDFFLRSD